MRKFEVDSAGVGRRTDVFIAEKYPEFTRSALGALFEGESVRLNGKVVKARQKLRLGDLVQVNEGLLTLKPDKIELPVIYEDENVVVINKPAGVLTHSKGGLNLEGTVASFLLPKINDDGLTGNRAGIVHRLDRATSGVIICAKNSPSLKYLQKQFSTRKTKKTYLAIVEGWLEPPKAMIDAPIMRNPKRPQTFKVGPGGKTAQTEYQTVKNFEKGKKKYALLELRPVTGRTHQLRVHLAYISHPIVGDVLYGRAGNRLLLHAASIEVSLPGGERKTFKTPTPPEFKDFIR